MNASTKKSKDLDISHLRRDASLLMQTTRVFRLDVRREMRTRKFLIQLLIQFTPILIIVGIYFFNESALSSSDALKKFTAEVTVRVLVPLAAMFYAAPIIADEIEQRTLTYLTLRPIDRSMIYFGKLMSSVFMTHMVTGIPFIAFALLTFALYGDYYENFLWLSKGFAAVTAGSLAFCAVFATLGTIFRSGILAAVLFYLVVEVILPTLPVLDLASISTHLGNLIDSRGSSPFSAITSRLADSFIEITSSASLAVVLIYGVFWTVLGIVVFRNRQYVI